jgi:hypothetical protein
LVGLLNNKVLEKNMKDLMKMFAMVSICAAAMMSSANAEPVPGAANPPTPLQNGSFSSSTGSAGAGAGAGTGAAAGAGAAAGGAAAAGVGAGIAGVSTAALVAGAVVAGAVVVSANNDDNTTGTTTGTN